jgi:hypothetical protein
MKELSLSFGHFKREDELPLTITVNGCTYQSQPLVDATKKTYFEMGKAEATLKQMPEHFAVPSTIDMGSKTWNETIFGSGYNMGYEAGKKAKRYTEDDINQLHIDMEHTRKIWYAHGKEEGYKEGYTTGFDNGLDAATIANTTAVKPSPCNHGECIAHIEEARLEGYAEGYKDGPQEEPSTNTSGIKESDFDKVWMEVYEAGYNTGREFAEHNLKYGKKNTDEEPMEEPEKYIWTDPRRPESEYDKGYYEGYEDGKNHIMQFIGNEGGE